MLSGSNRQFSNILQGANMPVAVPILKPGESPS